MMKLWVGVGVILVLAALIVGAGLLGVGPTTSTTAVIPPPAPASGTTQNPQSSAAPKEKPAVEPEATPAKPEAPLKETEKKPEVAKPAQTPKPAPKPAGLPKIVDIGGENCIPCKMMVSVLGGLRSDYKDKLEVVMIVKEKDPGALKRYRTSTIPTQILYDANGKEIARHFGFWAKDDILAAFKQHGIDLQEKN